MSPHHYARAVIESAAAEAGIPASVVLSRCRERPAVAARRAVAHRLRSEGWSLKEISRGLRMHHTSILHLLERPGPDLRYQRGNYPDDLFCDYY